MRDPCRRKRQIKLLDAGLFRHKRHLSVQLSQQTFPSGNERLQDSCSYCLHRETNLEEWQSHVEVIQD